MGMESGGLVPPKTDHERLKIHESLLEVVKRISQYLSNEEIWKRFTSNPQATGGIREFPYYRVDKNLLSCRHYFFLLKDAEKLTQTQKEFYNEVSNLVMEAILWVEIGFEGLQNLAVNPASKNWDTHVRALADDEQRAQDIMTKGKELYDLTIQKFVQLRTTHGITDDCFTQFKLESLLDKWK